jgi:hypothetical protein
MNLIGDPDRGELRVEFPGNDAAQLDEIVIGNWLHLERMSGANKRWWALILTDEKGRQLNLTIGDTRGKVHRAFVYTDEGWRGGRWATALVDETGD